MISESIMLPSMGIPYNKLEGSSLRVSPITTKIYKDFLINSEDDGIINMLDGCLVDSPLKAEELVYADQLALLFKIRSMSLGSEIKIRVHCPHCNNDINVLWDLMNADCEYLSAESYPFKVTLPESKTEINIFIPNSKMRRLAREEAKKRADKFSKKISDFLPQLMICSQLQVQGCMDIIEKLQWYESLSLIDSIYIDSIIDNIQNFGISTQQILKCTECDGDLSVNLMIDQNFFRPNFDLPTTICRTTKGKLATGI